MFSQRAENDDRPTQRSLGSQRRLLTDRPEKSLARGLSGIQSGPTSVSCRRPPYCKTILSEFNPEARNGVRQRDSGGRSARPE